jgi:chromosome segregation ATPase
MSPELEAAIRRLTAAIGQLEAAAAARPSALGTSRSDLETELQLMQDDRARLSVELESATARLNQVEAASAHVGQRLQTAIGQVSEVLARAEGADGVRS